MDNLTVIVLAAGGGTRMKSKTMKVLHPIAGRSMIGHVLRAVEAVEPSRVVAVVGHQREQVGPHITDLLPTAVLALPAVLLIAFGFASLGMGITSYLKTFQQMDWIQFFLLPMFLLSATFYPITVYPDWIQVIIKALPLWHGVELVRGLTTGDVDLGMLWHVLYYAVMVTLGLILTTRRLRALFLD